jgi:hypothetical protein
MIQQGKYHTQFYKYRNYRLERLELFQVLGKDGQFAAGIDGT